MGLVDVPCRGTKLGAKLMGQVDELIRWAETRGRVEGPSQVTSCSPEANSRGLVGGPSRWDMDGLIRWAKSNSREGRRSRKAKSRSRVEEPSRRIALVGGTESTVAAEHCSSRTRLRIRPSLKGAVYCSKRKVSKLRRGGGG